MALATITHQTAARQAKATFCQLAKKESNGKEIMWLGKRGFSKDGIYLEALRMTLGTLNTLRTQNCGKFGSMRMWC